MTWVHMVLDSQSKLIINQIDISRWYCQTPAREKGRHNYNMYMENFVFASKLQLLKENIYLLTQEQEYVLELWVTPFQCI